MCTHVIVLFGVCFDRGVNDLSRSRKCERGECHVTCEFEFCFKRPSPVASGDFGPADPNCSHIGRERERERHGRGALGALIVEILSAVQQKKRPRRSNNTLGLKSTEYVGFDLVSRFRRRFRLPGLRS